MFVRHEAEKDISTAYVWYEKQRPGLGDDFLLCIEAVLDAIRTNPHQYAIVHKQVRRALLRRFPHAVFYFDNGTDISVIAVFHCSRNPTSWQKRSN